ncbi:MAG: polyprenyl diphosphate synthase [Armatimonadetes bacterium]|nr:polyprenyl diphosphate synthase [Armatimonadota bacterium]
MAQKTYTEFDARRIPNHIAVIMDGNGRWARRKGLPRLEGHRRGYKALKDFVINAAELNVKVITAYAFSSENWRRPEAEVSGLMKLIRYAAKAELDYMKKEGVRIITSGRFHELPKALQDQFNEDYEATKDNSRIILNIAVNYGGRNEIVDAAKQLALMVADGKIGADGIDEKLISSLMYHPELPDPDLLIRTAGEMRVSNFLMWETAYSELYVTDTLWPDFSKDDLVNAIASYQGRTRKFGKVVEES